MLEHNQCFAPSNNGRCQNKCITNSRHCELHNTKSTKLYIKYKKLSDQSKNINLNKKFDDITDNINYILNCYNLFNRTFEARLKHRKFAIVPNLYDRGHDFQFIKLNNKINKCEEILNQLYILNEAKNSIDNESEDDDYDEDNKAIIIYNKKSMSMSEKIKLNKEHRALKEQEINTHVNKYIEQNKIIIERKQQLIYNLFICISLIFGEEDVINEKIIVIISLVIKLNNVNYFNNNFVPRTCKHPECTCKIPYGLSLGSEYLQDVECFCQYIESFSEESLKKIFELFLFNKKKILPFINDINALYDEYEDDVMYINAELVWLNGRLRLLENMDYKQQKQSKKQSEIFAIYRKKNKYYEQELIKNIFV